MTPRLRVGRLGVGAARLRVGRLGVGAVLVLAVAACGAGGGADQGKAQAPAPSSGSPSAPTSAKGAATGCVKEQGGGCLSLAPEGRRGDRGTPVFSRPWEITNPLFPIAEVTQSLQLGTAGLARTRCPSYSRTR